MQGCGNVGYYLAKELHEAGAKLIVTDIDAERVKQRRRTSSARRAVEPDEIYGAKADIFAPCALGGIINDETIPQLKVEIVAGAANNQLLEERHGDELEEKGILYAPDYVANAGGVINVYGEARRLDARTARSARRTRSTTRCSSVFEIAKEQGIPTYVAADRLAERASAAVGGLVRTWPQWPRKYLRRGTGDLRQTAPRFRRSQIPNRHGVIRVAVHLTISTSPI